MSQLVAANELGAGFAVPGRPAESAKQGLYVECRPVPPEERPLSFSRAPRVSTSEIYLVLLRDSN